MVTNGQLCSRIFHIVLILDVTIHRLTEICVLFVSYSTDQFMIIDLVECAFHDVYHRLL